MQRFLTIFAAVFAPAAGRGAAHSVAKAVEVPAVWTASQHLYVKGTVLPAERLTELESWLDGNAPNWTVVLTDNADGEFFTDAGGTRYSGIDAVEHALGKSLTANTGFGDLKHPGTGERSGAFFVLFLRERKFSYYAADVYDRRGLGEAGFTGNLDAPAIRAMRGGGRIADAVRDTVSSIDGELARRLAAEAEDRRRAAERERRLREETAAGLTALRSRIVEMEAVIADIRRTGTPPGDLLSPPPPEWEADLKSADSALAAGRNADAAAVIRNLEPQLASRRDALTDFLRAPGLLAAQQRELDAVRLHEDSARGQTALLEARSALKAALTAHEQAQSAWRPRLTDSERHLKSALTADAETRRESAELARLSGRIAALTVPPDCDEGESLRRHAATALEQARSRLASGESAATDLATVSRFLTETDTAVAAWERARAASRRALGIGSGLAAGVVLLAGFIGNRRRRPVKAKATGLLAAWEKTFAEKTDGLFQLLDRTRTSIGTTATLDQSGWSGETEAMARRTIRDADQLFIMSSSIEGVLRRARDLVMPKNPAWQALNFVSGRRFGDAVKLLSEDRLTFGAEDPLPALLTLPAAGAGSEWRGLLGKKEDCEPFTLTFDELISAFNERAQRAVSSLEQLDAAWLGISDARNRLDAALDAVDAAEKSVHEAAAADGLFALEPLFVQLAPAARADQEEADRLAATDPVGAAGGPLARGSRRAGDALALCGLVRKLREGSLPRIGSLASHLKQAGRRTDWVDAEIHRWSAAGATLAAAAAEALQSEAISTLESLITAFEATIREGLVLTTRASSVCLPEIAGVQASVQAAAAELGGLLGLGSEQMLCEDGGRNPSEKLTSARARHDDALGCLDRGDVAGAAAALAESDALCAEAAALVTATKAAFTAWPADAQRITARSAELAARIAPCTDQLRKLEGIWAATALITPSGDTLSNNVRDAEAALERARRLTANAESERAGGRILTSAGSHLAADECHARAAEYLDEISAQESRLAAAAETNRITAAELTAWRTRLAAAAALPAAMLRSVHRMRDAAASLDAALQLIDPAGAARDPFAAAAALNACRAALLELEQQLAADTGLFNDATASTREAERQLGSLTELTARSRQDRIPDSQEITRINDAVPRLEGALRDCRSRLAEAHGDWPEIDSAADAIAAEGARLRAVISNELGQAEQSVRTLEQAGEAIRALRGWSGSFGISAETGAGHSGLAAAREALNRGDYAGAIRLAGQSARDARNALDAAEAAVRRERHERARREEEARREAQRHAAARAAFSSIGSGSSISSRISSGSSSGGSSSGTARSSFSSDSGTARSGW